MISEVPRNPSAALAADADSAAADNATPPAAVVLARYGSMPQVARFACDSDQTSLLRGSQIVVDTDRGQELASVLETVPVRADQSLSGSVLRPAAPDDLATAARLTAESLEQFAAWTQRVRDWQLQLELVDLEWTLDQKLILYVLNDRGAETTRLALLAAANGLGIVHVQPVSAEGIIAAPSGNGGGCGSCGCSTH